MKDINVVLGSRPTQQESFGSRAIWRPSAPELDGEYLIVQVMSTKFVRFICTIEINIQIPSWIRLGVLSTALRYILHYCCLPCTEP